MEKEKLLKRYKALAVDLEYAVDDIEEETVKGKREKLAQKIKILSDTLREIETMENLT